MAVVAFLPRFRKPESNQFILQKLWKPFYRCWLSGRGAFLWILNPRINGYQILAFVLAVSWGSSLGIVLLGLQCKVLSYLPIRVVFSLMPLVWDHHLEDTHAGSGAIQMEGKRRVWPVSLVSSTSWLFFRFIDRLFVP